MTPEQGESQTSKIKDQEQGLGRQLYSEETSFLISHILSDRESRSATFGLENTLATPFWSAVKTGTSKDMRDNWCLGYSQQYTVGVWVGNSSGAPMKNVSGVTGAAPVWAEIMDWLHRGNSSLRPKPPPGVITQPVTFPGGVEPERNEWFKQGTEPRSVPRGLASARTRIVTPIDEAILAIDPDIPAARQRVLFEASSGDSYHWKLDGKELGPAATKFLWSPKPGRHLLSLVNAEQVEIDSVRFIVRGQ